jgi:hypothetical protein
MLYGPDVSIYGHKKIRNMNISKSFSALDFTIQYIKGIAP